MNVSNHTAKLPVRVSSLNRVEEVCLDASLVKDFLTAVADISIAEIEFSPLLRFQLAGKLLRLFGEEFRTSIVSILQDYDSGAVLIDYQDAFKSITADETIKLLTALTYTFGTCYHDHVSGNFYYKFTLSGEKIFKTPLNNPFKDMHIHTDGCFSYGLSDFVLMAKFEEAETEGGESKVLHVQDLKGLGAVLDHPLAWRKYLFKGRSAHNLTEGFYRQLFWRVGDSVRLNFNNATVVPHDTEEAHFLSDVHQKIDESSSLATLASGQCLILNNTFWLHGRAKFSKISENSTRTLLRMRGAFQSRSFDRESEVFAKSAS